MFAHVDYDDELKSKNFEQEMIRLKFIQFKGKFFTINEKKKHNLKIKNSRMVLYQLVFKRYHKQLCICYIFQIDFIVLLIFCSHVELFVCFGGFPFSFISSTEHMQLQGEKNHVEKFDDNKVNK